MLKIKSKEKMILKNILLVNIIIIRRYKDYTNAVEGVHLCIKKLVVRGIWRMDYFLQSPQIDPIHSHSNIRWIEFNLPNAGFVELRFSTPVHPKV